MVLKRNDKKDQTTAKKRPLAKRLRPKDWLRVTREGWLFIIICLAIGLAAIRSGNNLLFLILGMMLGLLVVSGILSELSLRGLSFSRLPPGSIHAPRCPPRHHG